MIIAHEESIKIFSKINQDPELMNVISTESFSNVLKAKAFTDRYEKLYPDVSKGIRGRRA
jgi:hypothetical protein